MTWQLWIGSGGMVGIIVLFFWSGRWFGKLDQALASIQKTLEKQDEKINGLRKELREDIRELRTEMHDRFVESGENFRKMEAQLSRMEEGFHGIATRISRLEGKDEERFRTEMKLMCKGMD